jgi:signal transduction histidine kinase
MRVIGHLRAAGHLRPHTADVAVAAVVFLVTLLPHADGGSVRDGLSLLLAGAAAGSLLVRRHLPYTVLLLSTIAAEAYLYRNQGGNSLLMLSAPLVALYTVAEQTVRRRSLLAGGAVVLSIGVFHTFGVPSRLLGPENLALVALGALAVAAGTAARHRRNYLAEVVRRVQEAEHSRELEAQQRVAEERLRIARDLHDSVGHQLALISVQAGVAAHVSTDPSAEVRDALRHIREGSRAALEDLRSSVGLLREPGEPAAPTEPTVGLDGLDDLLATFRRSGVRIGVRRSGPLPGLPRAADLTAYRVVQESLTNACRHAHGQRVRVHLRTDRDGLVIEVENDGPPVTTPADLPGHGIVGMRERVHAVGGTLRAGPRPGGGFRVMATLPGARA